jgi:hypothetical protein
MVRYYKDERRKNVRQKAPKRRRRSAAGARKAHCRLAFPGSEERPCPQDSRGGVQYRFPFGAGQLFPGREDGANPKKNDAIRTGRLNTGDCRQDLNNSERLRFRVRFRFDRAHPKIAASLSMQAEARRLIFALSSQGGRSPPPTLPSSIAIEHVEPQKRRILQHQTRTNGRQLVAEMFPGSLRSSFAQ